MLNNPKYMSHKGYTIYAIIGTILEVCLFFALVLWFLPMLGINLPWWGVTIMLIALLGYSYFTYMMGIRALDRKPNLSPESLIGSEGVVSTSLRPWGYVKIKGEMWKATAKAEIKSGNTVLVSGVDGMKLIVEEKQENKSNDDEIFHHGT